MKNIVLFSAVLVILIVVLLSLRQPTTPPPNIVESKSQPTTASPEETSPPLPLSKVVGQLFIIGHWADQPLASTTALIEQHSLGGIMIMSAPDDSSEITTWTTAWQTASQQPLFIAIDQEGGPVSRLVGTDFVGTGQRDIKDEQTAYQVGKTRGKELHPLGININFAPVLDSATTSDAFMYDRVFPDRTKSATLAAAMISGMRLSSVLAAVKHFPGHPDTTEDSHKLLPTVTIPPKELDVFTTPFRELLANQPPPALVTAHVLFPQIDNEPVSLSSFFIRDYLRNQLAYTGIIITDDLSMEAITDTRTSAEAAVQALAAGADMVLFAAEPQLVTEAVAAVTTAVEDGRLSEEQLKESYNRIIDTKTSLLSSSLVEQ